MVKFYFFKVCRETNDSGQWRTVLHPLPGQHTYVTRSNPSCVIDHTLKVQLTNTENHKVCMLGTNTIVGVRLEGDLRNTKLGIYSRNDTQFYRTEAEVFLIGNASFSFIRNADAEMMEAYHDLVDVQDETSTESETANALPHQEEHPADNGSSATVHPEVQTRIDMRELNAIEDSLMDRLGNERLALGKLLLCSMIRDRMHIGVAKFSYVKQNGEVRIAYGTRNREIIARIGGSLTEDRANADGSATDGGHFHYFDIQRRAWRCFCTEDVASVDSATLLTEYSAILSVADAAA